MKRCFYASLILGMLAAANQAQGQCNLLTSFTKTQPSCDGGSNGSISVQIFGQNPPFSYLWQNGAANQPLTNVPAGNYNLTLTDGTGCTQAETVSLDQPPPINLSLHVSPILCWGVQGGSVQAVTSGGVGNWSFLWNDGTTDPVRQNLGIGTYTVTATDGNGCSASASQTLTQPDSLHVEIVSMSGFCNGGTSGTITVQATGGTPPYKYVWITNGNLMGPTISGVGPGYFYVCVIDANGCQKDLPITIPPTGNLNVQLLTTSAECPGNDNGVATAVVSGGTGGYTYQWNIQNSPPVSQLNGIPAGTNVSVTVTDVISGCTGTTNVVVGAHNNVLVTVDDTDADCGVATGTATASATNGTAPYTYVWNLPGNPTNPTIQNLLPGAYQVSVTDAHGCTAIGVANIGSTTNLKADFNLKIKNCLPNGMVEVEITDASQPANLINSWNWNIAWGSGSTQPTTQNPATLTLSENETGTIQLTVGSSLNCTGMKSQPFDLSALKMSATANATDADCVSGAGGTATVSTTNASAPISYAWSGPNGFSSNNQNLTGLTDNGQYSVTASDARGCSAVSSANVNSTAANLTPGISMSVVECLGNQVVVQFSDNSTAGGGTTISSWQWTIQVNTHVETSTQQNPGTFTFPANGTGQVQLTIVANGCPKTLTLPINLPDLAAYNIQVSDNDVDCQDDTDGSVSVVNLTGIAPVTFEWTVGTDIIPGNQISNLGVGVYTVTATDARGCKSTGFATISPLEQLGISTNIGIQNCLPGDLVVLSFDADAAGGTQASSWAWYIDSVLVSMDEDFTDTFPDGATPHIEVIMTTVNGCEGKFEKDFPILAIPQITIDIADPGVSCGGLPVFIDVTGQSSNYVYEWSADPTLNVPAPPNPDAIANPSLSTTYQLTVLNNNCIKTFNIEVDVAPAIGLATDPEVESCEPTATLTATTTANPVDIVWSQGTNQIGTGNSVNVQVNAVPTVYTVVATDTLGCSETKTVEVLPGEVTASISGGGQTECENTDLSISVAPTNANFIYQWSSNPPLIFSPNDSSAVIINGTAGNYTITVIVTDTVSGCTKTLTTTVNYTDGQSLDGQIEADLCNGLNVHFENSSAFSGVWNFGDNSPTVTGNDADHVYQNAGEYIVTFSPNAACVGIFTDTIQVLDSAAVRPNFNFDLQNCDSLAVFKFTATGFYSNPIPANGYSWSFSSTPQQNSSEQNPTITFIHPGPIMATLVVTDANGCTGSVTKEVIYHIVNFNPDAEHDVCPDADSVHLNLGGSPDYTYLWTANPPQPGFPSTAVDPVVLPTETVTYTGVATLGGCQVTKTVLVTLNPAAQVTASDDKKDCTGDPVGISVLNPNAGSTYDWSATNDFTNPMGSGPEIQVNPPHGVHTYFVQITTAEGCKAVDSVKVTNGKVAINYVADQPICKGDVAILEVMNGNADDVLTYQIVPPVDPPNYPFQVSPPESTTYSLLASNQYGCGETATFNVDVTALTAAASTSKDTICPGQSVTLNAGQTGSSNATFLWDNASTLDDPTVENPTATPTESTIYTVTVTDTDLGCEATSSVQVNLINLLCEEPYIFIPKAFTPNGDAKNNTFRVRGMNIKEILFVVYDRWGEEVYKTTDPNHIGWDGKYKDREVTPDSYGWYVKVLCVNGETFIRKGDVTLLK